MMQKALFLDRDGVLNVDKGYVYKFSDIEWNKDIFDIIKFANLNNFLVIILTNQSGVAKGMYKESDVIKLHNEMNIFLSNLELKIDDWYYCIEDSGPRRKPGPGMLLEACRKYDIDLTQSFMIGDKMSDILNVDGVTTFLVQGRYPLNIDNIDRDNVEFFSCLKDIMTRLTKNEK